MMTGVDAAKYHSEQTDVRSRSAAMPVGHAAVTGFRECRFAVAANLA